MLKILNLVNPKKKCIQNDHDINFARNPKMNAGSVSSSCLIGMFDVGNRGLKKKPYLHEIITIYRKDDQI